MIKKIKICWKKLVPDYFIIRISLKQIFFPSSAQQGLVDAQRQSFKVHYNIYMFNFLKIGLYTNIVKFMFNSKGEKV